MSFLKHFLIILILPLVLSLAGCQASQDSKLVGTWIRMNEFTLPEDFPKIYWEFTADSDLLKYEVDELGQYLRSAGKWGFTKRNRLNISKFDVGFNGEWEIVTFKNDVLRMVLKEYTTEGNPSGQILVEFTKSRTL